jgi:hypothetical protein
MSNPQIRPHLAFYPEDNDNSLSEAWQAERWLYELDANLTTPMARVCGCDYFIHEPMMSREGRVYMINRFFQKDGQIMARASLMSAIDGEGWVVSLSECTLKSSDFLVDFFTLCQVYRDHHIPDPRIIFGKFLLLSIAGFLNRIGIQNPDGSYSPWQRSDPQQGNRWRAVAKGRRVVAFPIWLYCDDTSGNQSKKWNKHNSFLFTPAGLPRQFVHRESNIHFLCTSNLAPPLEMLDGIAEHLESVISRLLLFECGSLGYRALQETGIAAWDCHWKEEILVLPSVLAMLGDNPMQSEFACHIGFQGKYFCRVCWVIGRGEADENGGTMGFRDDASSVGSIASAASMAGSENVGQSRRGGKSKAKETLQQMLDRVSKFMTVGYLPDTDLINTNKT